MLQQDRADDYVIATGVSHSVRELIEIAFGRVGLDWQKHVGSGPGASSGPPKSIICSATATKAQRELGWKPEVDFKQLVEMMVDADLERLEAASSVRRVPAR